LTGPGRAGRASTFQLDWAAGGDILRVLILGMGRERERERERERGADTVFVTVLACFCLAKEEQKVREAESRTCSCGCDMYHRIGKHQPSKGRVAYQRYHWVTHSSLFFHEFQLSGMHRHGRWNL
jgi:hypothetical protein